VASLFLLPPTALPLSAKGGPGPAATDATLEQGLARLGYPGLAYRKMPGERRIPGELLLTSLSSDNLDPCLAEGLPWLLLRFEGLNSEDLVARAKSSDL